ncbi:ATP-binding cassette domain-containing protein, partial [Streptomyces sp. NPDC005180]|uniref:ABC transporter ATP-binding protein n=1 Tax=Streptomyces sp. NPDC005180 TaxID=3156868 RepID=UPI0033BC8CCB
MIRFDQVTVTYDGAARPSLRDADFTLPEGELTLLVGPSGAGKSTLLGAVSGLVPHFTGGTLRGRVTVAGRDTRTHRPRELADVVGTVGQDPLAHFVTDTVEDELAYGMESLGLAPAVMRRRVEETLDLLGLNELRDRPIATLSGGQQQRVAIGSVLTTHPKVLVLDEPTSALDPAAAEEVLAVLQRLVHDLGTTVLMAEHRLERVIQYADRILLLPSPGKPPVLGTPPDIMSVSPIHPPVVALGHLAGWTPLPLTIRDARRASAPLRTRLSARSDAPGSSRSGATDPSGTAPSGTAAPSRTALSGTDVSGPAAPSGTAAPSRTALPGPADPFGTALSGTDLSGPADASGTHLSGIADPSGTSLSGTADLSGLPRPTAGGDGAAAAPGEPPTRPSSQPGGSPGRMLGESEARGPGAQPRPLPAPPTLEAPAFPAPPTVEARAFPAPPTLEARALSASPAFEARGSGGGAPETGPGAQPRTV